MSAGTPKVSNLANVHIGAETTLGTETAAYVAVQVMEMPDHTGLTRTAIDNNQVSGIFKEPVKIKGAYNGEITLKLPFRGFSSSLPTAAPSDTSFITHRLVASAFGNAVTGGYSANESGSSATGGTPTLDGTGIQTDLPDSGVAVAWVDSDSIAHVNWVTAVATDQLSLAQTAEAEPAGGKVYGALTSFVTEAYDYHGGSTKSFSVRVRLHDGTDRIMLGCRPVAYRFVAERDAIPYHEITLRCLSWANASGSAPVDTTSQGADPEAFLGASIAWGTDLTTDTLIATGFEFDLGMEVANQFSAVEDNGIANFVVTKRMPRVKLSLDWDPSKQVADFSAGTLDMFSAYWGSRPGKMGAIAIQGGHVVALPAPGDTEGRLTMEIEFGADAYTGDTGTASASTAVDKICKFAFL